MLCFVFPDVDNINRQSDRKFSEVIDKIKVIKAGQYGFEDIK